LLKHDACAEVWDARKVLNQISYLKFHLIYLSKLTSTKSAVGGRAGREVNTNKIVNRINVVTRGVAKAVTT
tara:strand:- start:346 stop:558 length:213 start_codon:yes stop_codon:yes gene_type:complete